MGFLHINANKGCLVIMINTVSAWAVKPDYKINITRSKSRVGIVVNSEKIVVSNRVLLLSEQDHAPVYYFPRDDINMRMLHKTDKVTFCRFKGEAEHWSLSSDGIDIAVAAWSYVMPYREVARIKNYIAFYPEVLKYSVID